MRPRAARCREARFTASFLVVNRVVRPPRLVHGKAAKAHAVNEGLRDSGVEAGCRERRRACRPLIARLEAETRDASGGQREQDVGGNGKGSGVGGRCADRLDRRACSADEHQLNMSRRTVRVPGDGHAFGAGDGKAAGARLAGQRGRGRDTDVCRCRAALET